MGVLMIIGGLGLLAVAVGFVVYTRSINDAAWYGHYTETAYCYIFPGLFPLAGAGAIVAGFDRLGLPLPDWLASLLILPTFPLVLLGFLGAFGVPLPGFLTPRWIRERRRRDRQERRAARRARREARRTA